MCADNVNISVSVSVSVGANMVFVRIGGFDCVRQYDKLGCGSVVRVK